MPFSALGLLANLIANSGFSKPTDVQRQSIPLMLQGKDLMVCAQTGTGKTAAFALPLLQLLQAKISQKQDEQTASLSPFVLVLVPTRELAVQVADSFQTFVKSADEASKISILPVFGGANISVQRKAIAAGVDVLVATTGRLFDLLGQDWLKLDAVSQLVVDEADRMLDMGFVKDIQRVKRLLPKPHQTALFSATFTDEVRALAQKLLTAPEQVNIAANQAKNSINQKAVMLDPRRKSEFLAEMIGRQNLSQVLVFAGSKELSEQVHRELELDGIRCALFHGDKTQARRSRALEDFKSGKIRALVATDIAARGLDIEALPLVVNFDLPMQAEDYIHRIGRTGRAGHRGEALSLLSPSERLQLKQIEALMDSQISVTTPAGYELDAALPARYQTQSIVDKHKKKSDISRKKFRPKTDRNRKR